MVGEALVEGSVMDRTGMDNLWVDSLPPLLSRGGGRRRLVILGGGLERACPHYEDEVYWSFLRCTISIQVDR